MHEFAVKKGDKVKRGELIGYVGNTGLSTAPHLHYEVIRNNRKVNPVHYFFNDLTPEEYELYSKLNLKMMQSVHNPGSNSKSGVTPQDDEILLSALK